MNNVYTPVEAKAHTPPYKIHRYFARRPWNVFYELIHVFSKENDIILDPFCGGGVTIYEGLKQNRKVVGFDINPLSIFLVKNMVKKPDDINDLIDAYGMVINYIHSLYSDFNSVIIKDNHSSTSAKVQVSWNELAFIIECNYCGQDVIIDNSNKKGNGRYHCPNNKCKGSLKKDGFIEPKNCKRKGYEYLYSVATANKKKIKIAFDTKRKKKVAKHIEFLKYQIIKEKIEVIKDEIPLDWDRQHEDLLFKKGIKTFQDLFTPRNLFINTLTLNYIRKLKVNRNVYELLRLIFSSSLRDTNIMAFTNERWQSGNPTTWSKHAYWIPSQFCEVNVATSFQKAFNRVKRAIQYNSQFDYDLKPSQNIEKLRTNANILLKSSSVTNSNLPSESIDVIITDPPYGSNVQYLELSHFWYVWNKDMYKNPLLNIDEEAVANRKKYFRGSKSMQDYENNLNKVFIKCYELLKPGHNMIMTFNNKDIGAWLALLISIFKAGFTLDNKGLYFQDGVQNYRQTAHTKQKGSPYGDFIYVFKKPAISIKMKPFLLDEDDFTKELDNVFHEYLVKMRNNGKARNDLLIEMFSTVIPKIENYSKTVLPNQQNGHDLYKVFNKHYLRDAYA